MAVAQAVSESVTVDQATEESTEDAGAVKKVNTCE